MKILICVLIIAIFILILMSMAIFFFLGDRRANVDKIFDSIVPSESYIEIRDRKYTDRQWVESQEYSEHYITSYDGKRLYARYIKANSDVPSDRLVICVHGFHSNGVKEFSSIAKFYLEHGVNVLLTDQRGNGKSEGYIMTFGAREQKDVMEWVAYAREYLPENKFIALHGMSMGSASVLLCADKLDPEYVKCVIGDCGYGNTVEQIVYSINSLHLPGRFFMLLYSAVCLVLRIYNPFKLSPLESVSKCSVPVVIAHGECDQVVPVKMAYELYDACEDRGGKLVEAIGADHTQAFFYEEEYGKVVLEMLA